VRVLLTWVSFFCCVAIVRAQAAHPAFEVATVRPSSPEADPKSGSWSIPETGRFTATHLTLELLIQLAYDVDKSEITNKPDWLDNCFYDISAKPEDGVRLTREELRPRLQDLLRQRFHLMVHTDTELSRGYALIAAKGGPHSRLLREITFPDSALLFPRGRCVGRTGPCRSWRSI